MSFLYQALIKEQQKGKREAGTEADPKAKIEQATPTSFSTVSAAIEQPNHQYHQGFSAHVAAEQGNKNHWFWLVIAALLMIVGLLGGYLFGSKDTNQALYTNIQQQASQVQQRQQELEQSLADLKDSTEVNTAPALASVPVASTVQPPTLEQTADKQIEVAIGQDGEVKTQVTQVSSNDNTELEEQLVKRNILPEVAIEDIPDALKSTFADAVKATEQKQQSDLFEPQVTTGSSLPLIDELKLSEIYWVPDISYEMHIYASEPSERWIRLNGKTLAEGEALIDNLVLLEIRQDQIIWQGNDRRFAQNALQDFVKQ